MRCYFLSTAWISSGGEDEPCRELEFCDKRLDGGRAGGMVPGLMKHVQYDITA
jgi:hypothetical protein